jgi:hypothetical protein
MRTIILAFAALAALSTMTPAQATTTIFSVDFESGFGALTPTGQVGVNRGQDYADCCGATGSVANLANHFASFGSGQLPSGTLATQTYATLTGEQYQLDFDFAALGAGAETIFIDIFVDGALFTTPGLSTSGTLFLDSAFSHAGITVTSAADGTISFAFRSSGNANVDGVIDNVVFTTTAAGAAVVGVPEPATWAMLLLGFGAVGFSMRRHKFAEQARAGA